MRRVGSLSVVVVSHNSEPFLARCLDGVTGRKWDVVVVDNESEDGGIALVRERYPEVRVIELDGNLGYGAGNNVGLAATESEYVLLLNPDAWPLEDAVDRLVAAADAAPWAAVVGPRLLTPDGAVSASVRGFPTLWRLATEFLFLRWLAPRSPALNSFYGAGIDQTKNASVDWIVGAALLVRRSALDEVNGFDADYFMYDDEVDLCYRLRQLGWEVLFTPYAEFVHVGGGSSRPRRSELHREQLRSHIRFLDKHRGRKAASRARTMLLCAMTLRSLLLRGERRRISAVAARWLAAHDVDEILASGRGPHLPVALHRE